MLLFLMKQKSQLRGRASRHSPHRPSLSSTPVCQCPEKGLAVTGQGGEHGCAEQNLLKKKKKGCLGVPTVLKDLALSLQQPRFIHVASTVG